MSRENNNPDKLFENSEPVFQEKELTPDSNEPKDEIPHVNRKFAIAAISVFVSLLLLPSILWGILKVADNFNPKIMETLNFDTGENRAFAEFPTSFDAKTVTSDIEAWYNDNLPFRSVLYKTNVSIESVLERPYNKVIQPALIQLFHPSDQTSPEGGGAINLEKETEETTNPEHNYISVTTPPVLCGTNYEETFVCTECSDTYTQITQKKHVQAEIIKVVEPSYEDYGYTLLRCADCDTEYRSELYDKLYDKSFLPKTTKNGTIIGRSGWLFQSVVLPYYENQNRLSDEKLVEYASTFQELHELCEKKDIELLISIWPNKELVYPEYMPIRPANDKFRRVPTLVNYVRENTDVNIIYPIEELKAAKPYMELYLPLDTHWNRAGAFIGYQAMLKALGLETTDFRNLPIKQVTGGGSDLLKQAGLSANEYPAQKNYDIAYRPDVEFVYKYGLENRGSVNGSTHTTSNGKFDLNVLLIGDSYRLMHRDYIQQDFTSCVMGHKNHLDDPVIVEALKSTDVLIISSVERLDYDVLEAAKELIKLLSR